MTSRCKFAEGNTEDAFKLNVITGCGSVILNTKTMLVSRIRPHSSVTSHKHLLPDFKCHIYAQKVQSRPGTKCEVTNATRVSTSGIWRLLSCCCHLRMVSNLHSQILTLPTSTQRPTWTVKSWSVEFKSCSSSLTSRGLYWSTRTIGIIWKENKINRE